MTTKVNKTAGSPAAADFTPTIRSHLGFTALSAVALLVIYALLRVALLVYNRELIDDAPVSSFIEAFYNGLRFDLRLVVYACAPLLLSLFSVKAMAARGYHRIWLTFFASVTLFLGITELDFYREFHQRLNSLVFQYFQEDTKTVMSMIWNGFPVARYLVAWAVATWLLAKLFKALDLLSRPKAATRAPAWYLRGSVFVVCLLIAVVAARGHLRQGPPLRWGDAYTTESMFANQLGLNGTLTLTSAAMASFSSHRDNAWKSTMPDEQALAVVRKMLLTPHDKLVDADTAAIRRDFTPPAENTLPVKNVVVILLESFAGHFVGALGAPGNITPYFDKLAEEGVLFDRF